jgi:hypothetical protein
MYEACTQHSKINKIKFKNNLKILIPDLSQVYCTSLQGMRPKNLYFPGTLNALSLGLLSFHTGPGLFLLLPFCSVLRSHTKLC